MARLLIGRFVEESDDNTIVDNIPVFVYRGRG
jgi:hypothetical protein